MPFNKWLDKIKKIKQQRHIIECYYYRVWTLGALRMRTLSMNECKNWISDFGNNISKWIPSQACSTLPNAHLPLHFCIPNNCYKLTESTFDVKKNNGTHCMRHKIQKQIDRVKQLLFSYVIWNWISRTHLNFWALVDTRPVVRWT